MTSLRIGIDFAFYGGFAKAIRQMRKPQPIQCPKLSIINSNGKFFIIFIFAPKPSAFLSVIHCNLMMMWNVSKLMQFVCIDGLSMMTWHSLQSILFDYVSTLTPSVHLHFCAFGPISLEFQYAIVLIKETTNKRKVTEINVRALRKETSICLLIHSPAQSIGLINDESTYQT